MEIGVVSLTAHGEQMREKACKCLDLSFPSLQIEINKLSLLLNANLLHVQLNFATICDQANRRIQKALSLERVRS